MSWQVLFADEFLGEFQCFELELKERILASVELLQDFGPQLRRPHVDTLKQSKHQNMKELRLDASGGIWRVAFAFDPERKAILLVAGDKSGGSQTRFYRELIRKADQRFERHLVALKHRKD